MADNIVAGLFGLSPNQIQQQQQAQTYQRAQDFAGQSPFERANSLMYQGGAGAANVGAGMMGLVNPEVEAAKQREAVLSQADLQTTEGILRSAEVARQRGDVRMQLQLQALAQQRKAEESKMALEAAKTSREEAMSGEIPKQRHEEALARIQQANEAAKLRSEEALARIQQAADAAKLRSEDARLAIEQRREAAKQHSELLKLLAEKKASEKLTVGEAARDRKFGQDYAEYQAGGGSADVEKQLQQLQLVSNALGKPGNDYTGPMKGLIPESVRAFTNQDAVDAKNKVEEVAQRNLRLVLGAQFTQVEGERLIARAYNDKLLPEKNKLRIDALIKQIRTAAKVKEDAARYFEEHGTLSGWQGRMPILSDFNQAIEDADKTNQLPSGFKPL